MENRPFESVIGSVSKGAPPRRRGVVIRLLGLARPYWLQILFSFLLSLLLVPLSLLTPLPLRIAVDNVLGSAPLTGWLDTVVPLAWANSSNALLGFAVGLMVLTMLVLHLQALGSWLMQTYIGQTLVLEFRTRLFQHVQRLSLTYHDMAGTADSIYRIQYDAPSIQHITVNGLIPLLTSACTLIGMIWVTMQMDWQLALVALGVCPVIYVFMAVFSNRLKHQWKEVRRLDSSAMSVVHEVLASLRVVKAFGMEDREQDRFVRQSADVVRKQIDVAFFEGGYDLFVGMALAIGSAAGLYLGVQHVRSGALTLGQLLVVMAYLAMLYEPLRTLSKKVADIQSALASAERAFALLDQVPDVAERPHAHHLRRAVGAIEFRDVSFSYGREQEVLRGVSFAVRPGAKVGIQGMTGAGKTTMMSLLTRFYDPSSGQILLDGIDIREFRLRDLRDQFAIVLQEPVLFSTTIAENIAYGKPGATEFEIIESARLANADDFISALPDGYQTMVGERGMRLSGGERQRVAVARAFLRDAPILILDEPTSSVDVATEAKIIEAIERLMRDRTTFMIAHRVSTLEGCDVRLTIDNGQVIHDTSGKNDPRVAA